MAADAIGILGFALHMSHRVYQLIEKVKDAPEEFRGLQAEAARVRALLAHLQNDLGNDRLLAEEDLLRPLLKDARELESATMGFIKKVAKESSSMPDQLDVHKVKWVLHASTGKKLGEQFRQFYLSLSPVSMIITSRALSGVRELQQSLETQYRTIIDNGTQISSTQQIQLGQFRAMQTMVEVSLRSAAHDQRRGRSQLFDEACSASDRFTVEQFCRVPFPTPLAPPSPTNGLNPQEGISGTTQEDLTLNCDEDDILSHGSVSSPHRELQWSRCEDGCRCRCHRRRSVCPIPNSLAPWLGALHIPGSLISSFWPAFDACDRLTCQRKRTSLRAIKYLLPTWFVQVEASIRFECLPVHFCIQTPRVVESLDSLDDISLDEFKKRLSDRRLTIHDVDPLGVSIIHQLIFRSRYDTDTAYDMLSYILNRGAPREWCCQGLTPAELALQFLQNISLCDKTGQEYVRSVIIRGLLDEDVAEVSEGVSMKMHWTKLHRYFIDAECSRSTLSASLNTIPHELAAEVNIKDSRGWPSLFYALYNSPLAVEPLLRAGANPWLVRRSLIWATDAGVSAAVGPLIRAGVDVNERNQYGYTPLHIAADPDVRRSPNGYSFALELVRHGGVTVNWEARTDWGRTPLDAAEERAKQNPLDEESKLLLELYSTRRLPAGARYISSASCIVALPTDSAESLSAAPTSVIQAGLCGDIKAIGDLICAGAMVNEVDEYGHTLLHLVALGRVPNGYQIALELVRHGGYGVHWDAVTGKGKTALYWAHARLVDEDMDEEARKEAEAIFYLLEDRLLPLGEEYIFPCMDPDYCEYCSSNPCWCGQQDVPGMPGTFVP